MRSPRPAAAILLGALAVLAACAETLSQPTLTIGTVADVRGVLFFDLNGNGKRDATDPGVNGWTVRLVGGNGAVVATSRTDTAGVFSLPAVPTGRVFFDVDRARLGDTLEVLRSSFNPELVLARGDTALLIAGLSYPSVALASIDTVPVGRRVFTEGVALNGLGVGPRELHVRSGADALRVINVERRSVLPGDSVRVVGRRATELGQAVLNGADVFVIRSFFEDPEPLAVTTATAATARGGVIGADLARIRTSSILRARNELNEVILTVDDGTGALEILLRSFLGADSSFYNPKTIRVREARGLLIPYLDAAGQTRWRLAPRSAVDLRTEPIPASVASAPKNVAGAQR